MENNESMKESDALPSEVSVADRPVAVIDQSPEPKPAPVAATPINHTEFARSGFIPTIAAENPIEWTASEFVHHDKSTSWYLILLIVTVLFAAIIFFFTRDKISTIVIILAAGCLAFYARREPRQLNYRLDALGLTIGSRELRYELFRSFTINDEGAFSNIELYPFQRFSPVITIYFAPEDEDRIVTMLSEYLPMENRNQSPFDTLVKRIRF